VLKTIFFFFLPLTLEDVLRELKPLSDDPETRRLIRATWIYLTSNAEYMQKNIEALLGTFEEITGEKIMPTMVEIWKAEGKAEGKVEGKAEGKAETGRNMLLAILRKKFNRVPKETEQAILAMNDPVALQSWAVQASTCQSLDEFIKAFNG
jgi:predicted transposase YdaD